MQQAEAETVGNTEVVGTQMKVLVIRNTGTVGGWTVGKGLGLAKLKSLSDPDGSLQSPSLISLLRV